MALIYLYGVANNDIPSRKINVTCLLCSETPPYNFSSLVSSHPNVT